MPGAQRVIFHLDMDAFFASVEQRDHPGLRGRPVIVGAPPDQRGVVCAASYEARQFGIRSAMPSSTARRLCPKGIFIRPRMDAYRQESRTIMGLVRQTGALIEQVSIDEAYLDFTRQCPGEDQDDRLFKAIPLARDLQQRIQRERSLTASIGVASNKMLAKLGSDFNKPAGLTMIPERDKIAFLRPLPIQKIHGVGKVTAQSLNGVGIHTVADLQDYPGDLRGLIGSFGPTLKAYAVGEDNRPLSLEDTVKSISSESTFLVDTEDRAELRRCLREQAEEIAGKLVKKQLQAHTVQVKVRYSDFTTLTRQLSLEDPVTEAGAIYRLACHLLARHQLVSRPLRLLGLGVSNLSEGRLRQLKLPL